MDYSQVAEALKVIAHPVRIKIVELLRSKELSVSDIQRSLKIKQSITSQHLNAMKNKGILYACRDGNLVFYSILNKSVLKVINCLKSCNSSQ